MRGTKGKRNVRSLQASRKHLVDLGQAEAHREMATRITHGVYSVILSLSETVKRECSEFLLPLIIGKPIQGAIGASECRVRTLKEGKRAEMPSGKAFPTRAAFKCTEEAISPGKGRADQLRGEG